MNILDDIKEWGRDARKFKSRLDSLYWEQYRALEASLQQWKKSPEGQAFINTQLKLLNYHCPLCQIQLTSKNTTIDHLLPKSKYLGSFNRKDHLLLLCRNCNSGKANTEFHIWYSSLPDSWKERLEIALTKCYDIGQLETLLIESKKNSRITFERQNQKLI